jgi:D-lyxose ketol-isomerase
VFPPAMKGTGEGSYAWDLTPKSSMTNGTVGHLVVSNGNTMTVDYGTGKKVIIVPSDVPIVTIDPGTMSDLKPGLKVIVFPSKTDAKTAGTIVYGENGISPPQ